MKKIDCSSCIEKEELANMIVNHVNSTSYYDAPGTHSSTSTSPNNDFENYAQSFDQIKQTCQNLFTSISDKISSGNCNNDSLKRYREILFKGQAKVFKWVMDCLFLDFQKTTCFNQPNQNRPPTTQQPRSSNTSRTSTSNRPTNPVSPQTANSQAPFINRQHESSNVSAPRFTTNIPNPMPSSSNPSRPSQETSPHNHHEDCSEDCNCSDDEINEITEKRQSIFDGVPGPSGCSNTHVEPTALNSSSSDSSSFEEVGASGVTINEENWEVIEKTASNGIRTTVEEPGDALSINEVNMTVTSSPHQSSSTSNDLYRSQNHESAFKPEVRRLLRRRSDSSLINLRKSSSITIDMSSFDPSQSGSEVKKLKISCNKCGKAKSNIKCEILKLSEQLKSSNKSEDEVNAKIKEFLDYLESKSQPSEMTETEESQLQTNQNEEGARFIPSSTSHDEIEENIFDENEGINVYPSTVEVHESLTSQTSSSTPRRFISLDDIQSR